MGSRRLPGKVLLPLGHSNVLGYLIDRIKKFSLIKSSTLIVATTLRSEDDAIALFCQINSITCFRGSDNNVLERFYVCATKFSSDIIIRLTADCPLMCPSELYRLYEFFQYKQADYAYFDESYPEGICADIFTFDLLKEAWSHSAKGFQLEHVTPYMHSQINTRSICGLSYEPDCSDLRFTVDTPNDIKLVRRVVDYMESNGHGYCFDMLRIIAFLRSNHEVFLINHDEVRNASYDVFRSS